MKHSFHIDGNINLREARLLCMSPFAHGPEQQPQADPNQPEVLHVHLSPDQLTSEHLRLIEERLGGLHKQTEETVSSELDAFVTTVQRNVDAINSSPGISKDILQQYIRGLNDQLHLKGYHIGMIGKRVTISPHNPKVFAPEVIARRDKIRELKEKIAAIDENIRLLMRGYAKNGAEYKRFKHASTRPRNQAPEITRPLMELEQTAMQDQLDPMRQLKAQKNQLLQELAGITSGVIKVPVPLEGGLPEDPSLINDPRFAASGDSDGTRFNLTGAPGGIGPDGLPLQEGLPNAAEQAQILRYCARWRDCKTQEERDTVEGFLMMSGVNVDSSDLAHDEIVMVTPEERGIQFLIGLVHVLKSFIDRLNKKKTDIEGANVGEKDPSEMTTEERLTEKESNDKKLIDLKDKKEKTESDMKDIEKKLNNVFEPPSDEVKTKLESDLKQKKEDLKTIDEEIKKLEERNVALANPETSKEDEEGILKEDQLQEDPVYKYFIEFKVKTKLMLGEAMNQILTSGDVEKNVRRLAKALGFNLSDSVDLADIIKDMSPILLKIFESQIDDSSIEKNREGKYRVRLDCRESFHQAQNIGLIDKTETLSPETISQIASQMSSGGGLPCRGQGLTVISDFMDSKDFRFGRGR